MIVDSHCHLNLLPNAKVSGYLDEVVKAATVAGVSEMLCVSVSRSDIASVVALADRYPCVASTRVMLIKSPMDGAGLSKLLLAIKN